MQACMQLADIVVSWLVITTTDVATFAVAIGSCREIKTAMAIVHMKT